jgi:hypothetical protein
MNGFAQTSIEWQQLKIEPSNQYKDAEEYEVETLIDTDRDHYQLLNVGWLKNRLHFDIRNRKIWIQYDGTKEGIANPLVELSVPKDEIVLAFHEPNVRQYTDFATGYVPIEDF